MLLLVLLALLQAPSPPRTLSKGPASRVDTPRQVTVRTAAEWTALWAAHAPGGQPPAVDFPREMVVGVFLGTRPTGGYSVEVLRAVAVGNGLRVEYVETPPARDAMTAQVLTAPYHLVAIPRSDGEVQFQKAEK